MQFKSWLFVVAIVFVLASSLLLTWDALAQPCFPDCRCKYRPNYGGDNCDPQRRGDCCPNPCTPCGPPIAASQMMICHRWA
jgi:hypothetical protein